MIPPSLALGIEGQVTGTDGCVVTGHFSAESRAVARTSPVPCLRDLRLNRRNHVKTRIGLSLAALLISAASVFAADAPKACDKEHTANCQTAACCKKDAACCKDAAKCDMKEHGCKHADGKDHACSASCKKTS